MSLLDGTTLTQIGGTINVTAGGQLGAPYIVVNGGSVNVQGQESAMKVLDRGGSDIAYTQTGGAVTIDDGGYLGATYLDIQGGSVTIGPDALGMKGCDSGGSDITAPAATGASTGASSAAEALTTALAKATSGAASVSNASILSLGPAPAVVSIKGSYAQTATGTLQAELKDPTPPGAPSQLVVAGSAQLAGTLDIELLPDFAATPGATFDIASFKAFSGHFSSVVVRKRLPGGGATVLPRIAKSPAGESGAVLQLGTWNLGGGLHAKAFVTKRVVRFVVRN
jgi:hypothetical protein